ncbi:asparaginase [Nocardioides jishulii]|uniref:Asparaginase n=1 Tax=Nocardioides jishulii TaxID=2575440 RepID=A0A4U2YNB3_9ACTN|nr:asparaginase [Nocardioides jishulii]QCX27861.1 asparaginase [Nocardioides jishulii]TKI62668.1 asparaginase [Nocardioides jishulii]
MNQHRPTVGDAVTALPRIDLFALGGTIASVPAYEEEGALPAVGADDLLASVPQLAGVAEVRATQVLQVPSCEVTVRDLVGLVGRLQAAVEAGAQGVVVTQGTDTLEEAAFVVDLLWDRPEPVVFTGALRTPDSPGADGPANLLAAVQVAASDAARDLGVVVCLNAEIHAARLVRKTHASNPAAFTSPGAGPLGWVSEGRVGIVTRPVRSAPWRELDAVKSLNAGTTLPRVALVRVGLGEDAHLLEAVEAASFDGVVVEGVGGGHVPRALVPVLARLAERTPVLLASRTGAGEVLSRTYGYPGAEIDLLSRGLVGVGRLDGAKARLALVLALAAGHDRATAADLVSQIGGGW